MIRPLFFALTLFAGLGQSIARADLIYSTTVNPATLTTTDGQSTVVFTGNGGTLTSGSSTYPGLDLVNFAQMQQNTNGNDNDSQVTATIQGSMLINDGTATGTLSFSFVFAGDYIDQSDDADDKLSNFHSATVLIGTNYYNLANFTDTTPSGTSGLGFNNSNNMGSVSGDLMITPATSAVPEPSSLALMGLAGIAIAAGRRSVGRSKAFA